jgi:hypothetical protein
MRRCRTVRATDSTNNDCSNEEDRMEITGGCLCKAVRYRINSAPLVTRMCWCRLCQYLGAGSATINTCFASEAITVSGELRDFRSVADSGNVMHRRFCPTCGTPVFSAAEARPQLTFVRSGTLDDRELAKPAMIIWWSQAPSWACADDNIPRLEGQAPPAA